MSNFKDENAELRAYVKELQDERKVLLKSPASNLGSEWTKVVDRIS